MENAVKFRRSLKRDGADLDEAGQLTDDLYQLTRTQIRKYPASMLAQLHAASADADEIRVPDNDAKRFKLAVDIHRSGQIRCSELSDDVSIDWLENVLTFYSLPPLGRDPAQLQLTEAVCEGHLSLAHADTHRHLSTAAFRVAQDTLQQIMQLFHEATNPAHVVTGVWLFGLFWGDDKVHAFSYEELKGLMQAARPDADLKAWFHPAHFRNISGKNIEQEACRYAVGETGFTLLLTELVSRTFKGCTLSWHDVTCGYEDDGERRYINDPYGSGWDSAWGAEEGKPIRMLKLVWTPDLNAVRLK